MTHSCFRARARFVVAAVSALWLAGCDGSSTSPLISNTPGTPSPHSSASAAPSASPHGGASPTPSASATPTASATPSVSPTPAPGATPAALILSVPSLGFTATGYTLPFIATEAGYTGQFKATSTDCSGIATFTPASAAGPSATFMVSAVAVGKCHVTVADANNQTQIETIDVTSTTGTIMSR